MTEVAIQITPHNIQTKALLPHIISLGQHKQLITAGTENYGIQFFGCITQSGCLTLSSPSTPIRTILSMLNCFSLFYSCTPFFAFHAIYLAMGFICFFLVEEKELSIILTIYLLIELNAILHTGGFLNTSLPSHTTYMQLEPCRNWRIRRPGSNCNSITCHIS